MNSKPTEFYPFYDVSRDGGTLSLSTKIAISLAFGGTYMLLQYFAMPDKQAFFTQYCWILGIIISISFLALYVANDVFRQSLVTIYEFEGEAHVSENIKRDWLSDKRYLLTGLIFATANTTIGHLLGIPVEFYASPFSLAMIYVGFFLAGFFSGMGLQGILGVILLYLKFAPDLQHSLNPQDPDGNGGIKKLGDSLWFFGALIGAVGILVAIYMLGVDWAYLDKGYVQVLFVYWVAQPFIIAISIVLIPGLAVRKQVSEYKSYMANQLRQEKAKLYSSYKNFDEKEDDEIIQEKKQLNESLTEVQGKMEMLKTMRKSHIDSRK